MSKSIIYLILFWNLNGHTTGMLERQFQIKQMSLLSVHDYMTLPSAQLINKALCQQQIKKIIKGWHATGEWKKEIFGGKEVTMISPTSKIGYWVEVSLNNNEKFQAVRLINEVHSVEVSFNRLCESSVKNINRSIKRPKKKGFNDADLVNYIKSHDYGIIYFWSPQMPLSLEGIKEIDRVAKKLNIPILYLADPKSKKRELLEIVNKNNLPIPRPILRLSSIDLILRGASLHYPGLISFQKGEIKRQARYGHELDYVYAEYLESEFRR
jgi:hypothetical protein